MTIEAKRCAIGASEHYRRLRLDVAAVGQLLHCLHTLVRRTDLEEEIRPQSRFLDQDTLDELPGPCIGHGNERAHKVAIVAENRGMKVENGHDVESLVAKPGVSAWILWRSSSESLSIAATAASIETSSSSVHRPVDATRAKPANCACSWTSLR